MNTHPDDSLVFSDSPDFWGDIDENHFYGDIGKVSASTFVRTIKQMFVNDIWISVNHDIHTVLEAQYSPCEEFGKQFTINCMPNFQSRKTKHEKEEV